MEVDMPGQTSDGNQHLVQIPLALIARQNENIVQAFSRPGSILQGARCEEVNFKTQLLGFSYKAMSLFVARQTKYVRRGSAALRGDVAHLSLNNNNFLRLNNGNLL